jgi:hypothetical protein
MGQFNHQQQFMAILFFQSINWLTFSISHYAKKDYFSNGLLKSDEGQVSLAI